MRACGFERASSEIADLQAFNQHVIDSLASGLATTDRQGRILTFNRAAESITGHPSLSAVGRRIEDVLDLPPNVASDLSAGAAPGRGRRIETTYRTGDGRQIDLGFTATQLQTPGGNGGLLFAFQDVTDIKKSSVMRGSASAWPPSAKWPPASLMRFGIHSR